MDDHIMRLTNVLLSRNDKLSTAKAKMWVEYLWEDFEATRAKSGREYQGKEMTEKIVLQWISQYGPHLHNYNPTNEKFSGMMNEPDEPKH
ncbi:MULTISPECIES: YfhJ family protein [Sinobaca]|uniref:WVELL protein n=1 Tax=Sinobaca qinghaiensis TaxID=342944 RepID=A0A419UZF9_9BACL|nr:MULTISPECIES: YfhJ family protein [Sinobaca]RKD71052.1 WVELL protein [Sinobaca qinghaiensis]